MEHTHIIILNWNGGADTWKCVESVLRLPRTRITIVDNASSDGSVAFIREQLEQSRSEHIVLNDTEVVQLAQYTGRISLVRSSRNLGFAGGINLILRPLLNGTGTGYIWLLNNDAIAGPDTLSPLVDALNSDMHLGFAGSAIMDGTRHEELQCFGVRYYKWLGVGKMLFKGRRWSEISDAELSAAKPHFQHGASLLVRMETIRKLGLLDERFFLYSEEHDWQERAAKAGWGNVRIGDSKVYHLGSMSTARSKHLFYYYYSRSSVLFSRKHHKGITSIVATCMLTLITIVRTRLHMKSMRWALKGISEAWKTAL
jgi:GT2 family glycosyltransferase